LGSRRRVGTERNTTQSRSISRRHRRKHLQVLVLALTLCPFYFFASRPVLVHNRGDTGEATIVDACCVVDPECICKSFVYRTSKAICSAHDVEGRVCSPNHCGRNEVGSRIDRTKHCCMGTSAICPFPLGCNCYQGQNGGRASRTDMWQVFIPPPRGYYCNYGCDGGTCDSTDKAICPSPLGGLCCRGQVGGQARNYSVKAICPSPPGGVCCRGQVGGHDFRANLSYNPSLSVFLVGDDRGHKRDQKIRKASRSGK
jgi:hypothetical protein